MARPRSDEVNKSEEIRKLLREKRGRKAKEVVDTLAQRGITVTPSNVYFVRSQMRKRKGQARRAVERAAGAQANGDALTTVRKIRTLSEEVGGIKKLKALVDILAE